MMRLVVDLDGTLGDPVAFVGVAADAARDLGAREVNLIAPYLGYLRQDARFQPGEAVTSVSFARLLSGSFNSLYTVDPHLHQGPAESTMNEVVLSAAFGHPVAAERYGNRNVFVAD